MGLLREAESRRVPSGGLLREVESRKTLSGENDSSGPALEEEIIHYHKTHPAFYGILLETPPEWPGYRNWTKHILERVESIGTALPVNRRRSLVLLPGDMDGGLIAHRLVKSLPAKLLRTFEAETPGQALSILTSYR